VNKVMIGTPPIEKVPAIPVNLKLPMTFDEACKLANELAQEDVEAQKRDLAMTLKKDEASLRYLTAAAEDKAQLKRELDDAIKAHQEVRAEREAARLRWKAASDRVLELSPTLSRLPANPPGQEKPSPVNRR